MISINGYEYDWVGSFAEGLAPAMKVGKRFHIRHDGSPAYEARFDEVGPFSEALAEAKKGDKWFYIRPDGTRAD